MNEFRTRTSNCIQINKTVLCDNYPPTSIRRLRMWSPIYDQQIRFHNIHELLNMTICSISFLAEGKAFLMSYSEHKHTRRYVPRAQTYLRTPFLPLISYASIINSLGPSDAIWRQKSGSTLAQVMACCLTAPSHYLNQCWLIISKV